MMDGWTSSPLFQRWHRRLWDEFKDSLEDRLPQGGRWWWVLLPPRMHTKRTDTFPFSCDFQMKTRRRRSPLLLRLPTSGIKILQEWWVNGMWLMSGRGGKLVLDVLWVNQRLVQRLLKREFTSSRGGGGAERDGRTGRRSDRTQCSGKVWFLCACGSVGWAHRSGRSARCSPPRCTGRVSLLEGQVSMFNAAFKLLYDYYYYNTITLITVHSFKATLCSKHHIQPHIQICCVTEIL